MFSFFIFFPVNPAVGPGSTSRCNCLLICSRCIWTDVVHYLCYFIWSRDNCYTLLLVKMYIADIKLVEWFSYISWIVFLFSFHLVFSVPPASPQLSPHVVKFIFLWNSQQTVGQKTGGFDVKENYFYKCGNKSLSFNHVAAWICVRRRNATRGLTL